MEILRHPWLYLLLLTAVASTPLGARAVTIVYTNDILGELEPCGCRSNPTGGMVRKAAFIDQLKKANPSEPLLQLDGGDLLFDSSTLPENLKPQAEVQARALLAAHDAIGQDAFVPGEKDFALGTRKLKELLRKSRTQALSTNLIDKKSGNPVFQTSKIYKFGKRKIAVIGVSGTDLSWPADIKAAPAIESFRKEWKRLLASSGKLDALVALTHQGVDADRELARAIPEIDVIIGGHSQSFLQTPEKVEKPGGHGTLILQSSFRNQWVGKLPLDLKGRPIEAEHRLVQLDAGYEPEAGSPDPYGMKARVSRFKEEVAKTNEDLSLKQAKLSRVHSTESAVFQTFPKCAECHLKQFDFWRKTPHGGSYAALVAAQQAENQECIVCHSAGFGKNGGWNDITKPAERSLLPAEGDKSGSTRTLGPAQITPFLEALHEESKLTSKVRVEKEDPDKVTLLNATRQLSRVWVNVQCESCHQPAGDHPFGEAPYSKTVETETCLGCHTPARAPGWYSTEGKLNSEKVLESRKKVGCPAGTVNEEDL